LDAHVKHVAPYLEGDHSRAFFRFNLMLSRPLVFMSDPPPQVVFQPEASGVVSRVGTASDRFGHRHICASDGSGGAVPVARSIDDRWREARDVMGGRSTLRSEGARNGSAVSSGAAVPALDLSVEFAPHSAPSDLALPGGGRTVVRGIVLLHSVFQSMPSDQRHIDFDAPSRAMLSSDISAAHSAQKEGLYREGDAVMKGAHIPEDVTVLAAALSAAEALVMLSGFPLHPDTPEFDGSVTCGPVVRESCFGRSAAFS